MNIKSEKGFSGIDLAISIMVIFIFITLISIIFYNMNSETNGMELKSQALELCVQQIEKMKSIEFSNIKSLGIQDKQQYTGDALAEITVPEGFTRTVYIEDYNHINNNALPEYVKKITVEIAYKYKKQNKKVELSTIVTK